MLLGIKRILFSFIILLGFKSSIAQSFEIKGKWLPQTESESCWAACLSNVSSPSWKKTRIQERHFYAQNRGSIETETFKGIADQNFRYSLVHEMEILSFRAIQHYLSYKYPRPLVNSFVYEGVDDGHFYNIVGHTTIPSNASPNDKWLCIYDPKPDGVGNKYLKSYSTYSTISNYGLDLNATYFHFRGRRIPSPRIIEPTQQAIFMDEYSNANCLDTLNIVPALYSNVNKPEFVPYVGDTFSIENRPIPIISIFQVYVNDSVGFQQTNFATIEYKVKSNLYCTYVRDSLVGGITVQKTNASCALIDRIENLEKYKQFSAYFRLSEAVIIEVKNGFRFLRFKENGEYKTADLDNFIAKSNTLEVFSDSVFLANVATNNLRISMAGLSMIQGFNDLVNIGSKVCVSGDEKAMLVDIPIADLRDLDKGGNERSFINGKFPIRINFIPSKADSIESNDVFMLHWESAWLFDNNLNICYPKLGNYQQQDGFFAGNKSGGDRIYFVPISKFKSFISQNSSAVAIDVFKERNKFAIKASDIIKIEMPRLELPKVFLGSKFEKNYKSKFSPVGIICDVILKNGNKVNCYLFNNVIDETQAMASQFAWKR